jgi:hypothetical protein
MKKLLILLSFVIMFAGCSDAPRKEFMASLAKLGKADSSNIESILKELDSYSASGLNLKEAREVIRLIPGIDIKREHDFEDTQADLVRLLAHTKDSRMVAELLMLSDKVGKPANREIVSLLTNINDSSAVDAVFRILGNKNISPETILLSGWKAKTYLPDSIFPRLLGYLGVKKYRYEILLCTLNYLEKNKLSPEVMTGFADKLHFIFAEYTAGIKRLALDRTKKNWQYSEFYQELREDYSLFLDVLGYCKSDVLAKDLAGALDDPDPRILYFGLLPSIRAGKSVDAAKIALVAADPEMRKWLFESLRKYRMLAFFPQKYKDQEMLAESDLVNWLIYPTELGVAPDEIELGKKIKASSEPGGSAEYFVFRFRTYPPHWAAKDGWMAGVAGPFVVSEYPTTDSYGETFSEFEKWDSKTPEEHLAEIRKTVAGANKN